MKMKKELTYPTWIYHNGCGSSYHLDVTGKGYYYYISEYEYTLSVQYDKCGKRTAGAKNWVIVVLGERFELLDDAIAFAEKWSTDWIENNLRSKVKNQS